VVSGAVGIAFAVTQGGVALASLAMGVSASGVIAGGVGDGLRPSLESLERLRQLVLSGRMERAQLEWLEQVRMSVWAAMHSGGKWCACGP